MKMCNLKLIILIAILAISGLGATAQVTIGSGNTPQDGVLLELKTKDVNTAAITAVTDDANETVDNTGGGLLFPRVKLVNRFTLEPFIPTDADWTSNANKLKETHAGMVVYNIYKPTGTISADIDFDLGLYVWNGNEWVKLTEKNDKVTSAENRFFYLPSFNIELAAIADNLHFNLYDEYVRQFTLDDNITAHAFVSSNDQLAFVPSHKSSNLYAANELDYVVTYYDKDIVEIVSIGTNGDMLYNVKSLNLTANSFINVVLVVR
jgi:hypothetical protein